MLAKNGDRSRVKALSYILGVASVVLASCGNTPATTHELKVSLSNAATPGTPGWSVVQEAAGGESVTVANASGTVIATGGPIFLGGSTSLTVPITSYYKVTIGTLGTVTFSLNQVKSAGWTAAVSVGS